MEVSLKSLFNWTGECPYWDPRTQELSLVDACTTRGTSRIIRWNPVTNSLKSFELDQCASFNIPASDVHRSVVSYKNQILKFNWQDTAPENRQFLVQVDKDKPLNRLNDAKCDPRGVLIAGTMSDERSPGVVFNPRGGSLFRFADGDKEASTLDTGFDLSNGLDWNSDGSKMFFADSCTRTIYVFDYEKDLSSATNRRACIDFNEYKTKDLGLPDGMTMDVNNHLWVTCFWSGIIVQFDVETGKILQEIKFPTACTTSCCFGGPELTDLYITSSKFGVGNDPQKGIEQAGSLFKVPGSVHGARGYPMNPFQLND